MKKLLELLARHEQVGDFGIEIEAEGRNLARIDNRYWRSEYDGSLRDGMEYVMKSPKGLKYIRGILKTLKTGLEKAGSELEFSFRTSVHVHMNVQRLTVPQMLNTVYTYLLLENVLLDYCGEDRKSNRFCLRLADAEHLVDVLSQLFKHGSNGLRNIPKNQVRYSSINIEAILKYGSLEFRAMQGNLDVERITVWCKALAAIRDFACKFENPAAIYNHYIRQEAQGFFDEVMGPLSPIFTTPSLVKDIQQNFSLSIDLPFSYVAEGEVQGVEYGPKAFRGLYKPPNPPLVGIDARAALRHIVGDGLFPRGN